MPYDREYFVKQGRKGGNTTKKRKGLSHYKRISKLAAEARKQNGKGNTK